MKLCDDIFVSDGRFNDIFSNWPFKLSDFQKWAIVAIYKKKHALVTAHTGSGKTLLT